MQKRKDDSCRLQGLGKFRVRAFEASRYVTHLCRWAAHDPVGGGVIKASAEGNIAAFYESMSYESMSYESM
jgi:hypothetical protein